VWADNIIALYAHLWCFSYFIFLEEVKFFPASTAVQLFLSVCPQKLHIHHIAPET